MATFADRLKLLRTEKGLTQQDIADTLNVGRATVAGYETKGKQPDFDKLSKLCDLFNVSLDYLVGRSEIRNPYLDSKCGSSAFLNTAFDKASYDESQKVTNKNTYIVKKSQLITDNKNTYSNVKHVSKLSGKPLAETLAEKFLDLLIASGEIKTKEDLTTGKALKILGKIFDQLKEDTK